MGDGKWVGKGGFGDGGWEVGGKGRVWRWGRWEGWIMGLGICMVTVKDVHPSNLELILTHNSMCKVEHYIHHFCFLSPSDRLVMSLYT